MKPKIADNTEDIAARNIEIIANYVQPYHQYGESVSPHYDFHDWARVELELLSNEMLSAIARALLLEA